MQIVIRQRIHIQSADDTFDSDIKQEHFVFCHRLHGSDAASIPLQLVLVFSSRQAQIADCPVHFMICLHELIRCCFDSLEKLEL